MILTYLYKILVKVHLVEVGIPSLIMISLKFFELYIESACLKHQSGSGVDL